MFPRALFTANPYTRGTQIYSAAAPSGLLDLLPAAGRVAIWYAGDGTGAGSYVTTAGDGQPVDAIIDQVGSDDLANTSTGRPTYDVDGIGGRGALVLSGSQYLSKAVTAGAQTFGGAAYAVYMVASVTTLSAAGGVIYGEGRGASASTPLGIVDFLDASPDIFRVVSWLTTPKVLSSSVAPSLNTPYLITVYRASGTITLRVNGVQRGTVAETVTDTTLDRLAIGALVRSSVAGQLTGRVGIVARYADNTDFATAESVLAEHYGITLP